MPVGTPRAARRTRTLAGLDFKQRIFFNAHLCGLARESRGRAPHAPYPGDTRAHTWGQPKTPQRFWGDSREVRHRPTRPGRHPPGGTRPHGPAEQCAGTPLPGRTEAPSGFPARSRPSGGRLKGRPLLRPPCHPDVWGEGPSRFQDTDLTSRDRPTTGQNRRSFGKNCPQMVGKGH